MSWNRGIYALPMKTSVYMGDGVSYHSTTRSPIFPLNKKISVKNRLAFESPEIRRDELCV